MAAPSRTVLVTGAGARLGAALALSLGDAGWSVAIHYNTAKAPAEAIAAKIQAQGGAAQTFQADFTKEAQTAGLIAKVVTAMGPLTALVNNASIFEKDAIETMTRESWDAHLEINLRAPVKLAQDFQAQLPAGETGAIVNIVDQRVLKLTPQFASYTLSKFALWGATHTLAQAMAPHIRVNAIAPGPTFKSTRQSPVDWSAQNDAMPLGKGPEPQDICQALHYILNARSLTGQTIAVDGGQRLIWRTPDVHGLEE